MINSFNRFFFLNLFYLLLFIYSIWNHIVFYYNKNNPLYLIFFYIIKNSPHRGIEPLFPPRREEGILTTRSMRNLNFLYDIEN